MFFQQGGATNWWTTRNMQKLRVFEHGLQVYQHLRMDSIWTYVWLFLIWIMQFHSNFHCEGGSRNAIPCEQLMQRESPTCLIWNYFRGAKTIGKVNATKKQRSEATARPCSARGGCVGHGGQQIVWFISAGKNGQFAPSICGILRNKCCSFSRVELCGIAIK